MLKPFALVAVISVAQAITLASESKADADAEYESWWSTILAD